MIHQVSFIYLACQTCQAKIHCDQCGETLSQSLLQRSGIIQADLNMISKIATIDSSLPADDLEICLEDLGVLMD